MASSKRRKNTGDSNIQKKRAGDLLESVNRNDVTRLEDLSNELIYEIVHCLDSCEIYDAFFNLNSRFRHLVFHSTFPIKIHFLTSLSRSDFQRYYNQILLPNQHRVELLYLSNPFIIERLFSSTCIFLQLIQLETLIVNPIESKYLLNLLDYLLTLPKLSSLALICQGLNLHRDELYDRVFRLPVLIYCKLSFNQSSRYKSLPIATNQFSPIEHFLTSNLNNISELPTLLSYLPRLKHLSIRSLHYSHPENLQQISLPSDDLTHVTLNILNISFDDFQSLVRCCFHHVRVLHMSTVLRRQTSSFVDADQWRSLIISFMPWLRIFDIFIRAFLWNGTHSTDHLRTIKRFQSPFWFEHGWNFSYFSYGNWDHVFFRFFSSNPYRRRKFILDERKDFISDLNRQKISINSVEQLEIHNIRSIDDYQIDFPNVTELTIIEKGAHGFPSILSNNLNKILPLYQLTQFSYETLDWDFIKVIQFFQHMPNLETFEINFRSFMDSNIISIEQDDTFQLISRNNKITKMVITTQCPLDEVDILFDLCPRLKQLSIQKYSGNAEYFFDNIQTRLKDLVYLSIICSSSEEIERLQTSIESEKLFSKCSIKSDTSKNSLSFWL